jgi:hypothetical protein
MAGALLGLAGGLLVLSWGAGEAGGSDADDRTPATPSDPER